jgi:hypothetical protein
MQFIKQVENHIYHKFLKVPARIAALLGLITLLAVIEAFGLNFGFWGVVGGTMVGTVLGLVVSAYALSIMKQERLRIWLGDKFADWTEASKWIVATDPKEFNRLVGLSQEEWAKWQPGKN